MATFSMPVVSHKSMPVVPTARIKALMQQKANLESEATQLQTEINRLAEIEQRKVFARFKRDIGEAAITEYLDRTSAPESALNLVIEGAARDASDDYEHKTNLDFRWNDELPKKGGQS